MDQGDAARSYGSYKSFDYIRKRTLSRAAAQVSINMERSRNRALKQDGVNQRMAKTVADLLTEEVRDEHN
jgi:hypothetical protein